MDFRITCQSCGKIFFGDVPLLSNGASLILRCTECEHIMIEFEEPPK